MSKKNIFQNNNIPSETKDNVAILDEHIKYVLERFPILEDKVNSIQKDNNTLRELVAQLSKKLSHSNQIQNSRSIKLIVLRIYLLTMSPS